MQQQPRVTVLHWPRHQVRPLKLVLQRAPSSRRFELVGHDGNGHHFTNVLVDGVEVRSFPTRRAGYMWCWARQLHPAIRVHRKGEHFGGWDMANSVTMVLAA